MGGVEKKHGKTFFWFKKYYNTRNNNNNDIIFSPRFFPAAVGRRRRLFGAKSTSLSVIGSRVYYTHTHMCVYNIIILLVCVAILYTRDITYYIYYYNIIRVRVRRRSIPLGKVFRALDFTSCLVVVGVGIVGVYGGRVMQGGGDGGGRPQQSIWLMVYYTYRGILSPSLSFSFSLGVSLFFSGYYVVHTRARDGRARRRYYNK